MRFVAMVVTSRGAACQRSGRTSAACAGDDRLHGAEGVEPSRGRSLSAEGGWAPRQFASLMSAASFQPWSTRRRGISRIHCGPGWTLSPRAKSKMTVICPRFAVESDQ